MPIDLAQACIAAHLDDGDQSIDPLNQGEVINPIVIFEPGGEVPSE